MSAPMNAASGHVDSFAREHLPPRSQWPGLLWTCAEFLARANRIAHVLTEDMGLVPGNRVLLHGPNTPQLAACWFAALKAGAVPVPTMPPLRAKELSVIIDKARIPPSRNARWSAPRTSGADRS